MVGALILVDNPFSNVGYDQEYEAQDYLDQPDFGANIDIGTAYNSVAFGAPHMMDADDGGAGGGGGCGGGGCGGGGCGGGGCGGGGCGGCGG